MKILKIFGIVAGIHAIALIMIFANPGCNSTGNPPPAPKDTAPKADPAPSISLPGGPPPAGDGAAIVPAPVSSAPDTTIIVPGLFSPTRPGTLAAGALEAQPAADVTPATTYIVGKGDSLWSIAKKNNLKVSVLAKANGIHSGTPLHLGQRLIIPGAAPAGGSAPAAPEAPIFASGRTAGAAGGGAAVPPAAGATRHVVRPGETLGAIARKFGVRVGDLALANNISDPQTIRPGQELVIPAKHPPSSRPARDYGAASPVSSPAAPAASTQDQDLDAGLKPAAPGDVPAIKLDDTANPPAEPRQP